MILLLSLERVMGNFAENLRMISIAKEIEDSGLYSENDGKK